MRMPHIGERYNRAKWGLSKALRTPMTVSRKTRQPQQALANVAAQAGLKERQRQGGTQGRIYRPEYSLLERVIALDLLTGTLVDVYADAAARSKWDIVPDVDAELDELRRWQNQEVINVLQTWNDTELAPFESDRIDKEVVETVRNNIKTIREKRDEGAGEFGIIRMLEQTFTAAESIITQTARKHANEVRDLFMHPNEQDALTFGALIDPIARDICQTGIAYIATTNPKAPSKAKRKIAELYRVKPEQMTHYVTQDDDLAPKPPDPAYIRRVKGSDFAQFTRDEVCVIRYAWCDDTYAVGPVERALVNITRGAKISDATDSAIARTYRGESILSLGPDVSAETGAEIAASLRRIIAQQGLSGEIPVIDGVEDPKILRMGSPYKMDSGMLDLSRDVKANTCAAFHLSPQDAAQLWDFHNRSLGEVQMELTRTRGIRMFLNKIAEEINGQIVKPGWSFKDVKFAYTQIESEDVLRDMGEWKTAIDEGVVTRAFVAERLGGPVYPGQSTPTFNSSFTTPVARIQTAEYVQQTGAGQNPQPQGPGTFQGVPAPTQEEQPAVPVPDEFNPWSQPQAKVVQELDLLKHRLSGRVEEIILKAERGDAEGVKRIARDMRFHAEEDIDAVTPKQGPANEGLTSIIHRAMLGAETAARQAVRETETQGG